MVKPWVFYDNLKGMRVKMFLSIKGGRLLAQSEGNVEGRYRLTLG